MIRNMVGYRRSLLTLTVTSIVRYGHSLSTLSASSLLKDPSLLLRKDSSKASFEVRNPADPDSVVANVAKMTQKDAQEAIDRCAKRLPSWRDETTGQHRSNLLREWSKLITENANDMATLMTLESGKPLQESLSEVGYATSFLDYYAAEAIRPTSVGGGFMVPSPFANLDGSPKGKIMAIQEAVGVTAMITPWNFPIAMITRKVGPALAAGCTTVVKPSELTPLSAIAMQQLALRANIPPGVFEIVTTDHDGTPAIGNEFCSNPMVKKISFTGSTVIGKLLMKLSSDTVKRLSLELGGNAPFVVFDDADIDQAVAAAVASKFRNAGQTCVCADRFLVHSSIHDEFVSKFVEKANGLQVGCGLDKETNMGPVITSQAADNIHAKVLEAIEEGATCELGGNKLLSLGSHFFEPTILTNVSPDSRVWNTETFGPVAAVRPFETEEEAAELANNSDFGLASYFMSKDMPRAFRFASKLESGLVGVNEGVFSTCVAPFGGVKESGLGREGSPIGIAEYLETKYVFINP
mmetsp:Transcript_16398/g.23133  ORF Transcript_16398/g.23133 Transcript_16398/m.23133 type:complete len:523 (-) Transcript_16398:305-1873(-)